MPAPVLSTPCERCGKPGELRHFPGPVPYTGSWCDRCYRIVGVLWLVRTPMGWVHLAVYAVIVWVVGTMIIGIIKRL